MKSVALKDLAKISAGYPFRGAIDSLPAGDVAAIQMRNIDPNRDIDWGCAAYIDLPSKRTPGFLKAGDIIFAARGTCNYALALEHVLGRAVCSPHFFVIRVTHPEVIMPTFLAWQINQGPIQKHFQRTATGSHILSIRREVVENLIIAVPPITQQEAIVNFAAAARAERLLLSHLIQNRTQQMEAIALSLFSHSEGHIYG